MDNPITIKEIKESIQKKQFIAPDFIKPMNGIWDISTREQHIHRIAWFVENYKEIYPIEIDFGIPGFCELVVEDGNHRLAAAIYLGLSYVWATTSGATSVIESFVWEK
jgi:uncharacterized protein (DUF1015 family)